MLAAQGSRFLIFVFIRVWCMSKICMSSLRHGKGQMSFRVTKLLTSFVSSASTLVERAGIIGLIVQISWEGFCFGVANTKELSEFRHNATIPCFLLESFDCPSWIQQTLCSQKTEQHVFDNWQDFNGVATIHALMDFVQNDPASSRGITSPMIGTQAWPYFLIGFFLG